MDWNLIETIIYVECIDVKFHMYLTSLIFMLNIEVIRWVNDSVRCFVVKLNDVYMTYIDDNKISIMIIENSWYCECYVECVKCKFNIENATCNHISSMDIRFRIQNIVIVMKQLCDVKICSWMKM